MEKENAMLKLSRFIVEKRYLIFLILIISMIFSIFSVQWVQVESDLIKYLPDNASSTIGLEIMEEEFITYGMADLMFANVTYEEAEKIYEEIKAIEGVQSVTFDNTTAHYNNVSALFSITFDYPEKDENCLIVLDEILAKYEEYDTYLSTMLGNALQENLNKEVSVIMVIVAIIVLLVVTLTSESYGEVPVLVLTFVSAMILNMGTNFLMGTISFISNSVTSTLQLALSLDYAVIMVNRYREEHQKLPTKEAVIVALSKAIPEISSSSLTTIGGLVAMMFMQFKVGPDMAINLIKSIIFALAAVFFIMPGLLVFFAPLIDKWAHKSFIPKIPFVGTFAYKTYKVIPPIFIVIALIAVYVSGLCPYAYGEDGIATPLKNETQIAKQMMADTFTSSNMIAVVVPSGDYEKEKAILDELTAMEEVSSAMGLSNIEAMEGYTLTSKLNPRQFSELIDLDYEIVQILYTAYATSNEVYGEIIGGIGNYSIPLMDIFLYVCDMLNEGLVELDSKQQEMLDELQVQLVSGKQQLQGEHYSRMLVYTTLPLGSETTYAFVEDVKALAQSYYPNSDVHVVGNVTTEMDFKASFGRDNVVVSVVSILIVLVVLLFTFKSVAMPIILIAVIQGCIWINFSFPTLMNDPVFFLSYLITSSIQMGANIDYAIVAGSRFMEIKDKMPKKDAIIETMNFAFPTIITSGSIMIAAGFLVGNLTSSGSIVSMGQGLCRGTCLSIILCLFVLPQMLLIGEKLVDRTTFSMSKLKQVSQNLLEVKKDNEA
ncbi:MAG: MMPL family transporter [Lachnospiraceae bacterium]|nr:MMPL family transporter [Lachnospiraceae bacterium]